MERTTLACVDIGGVFLLSCNCQFRRLGSIRMNSELGSQTIEVERIKVCNGFRPGHHSAQYLDPATMAWVDGFHELLEATFGTLKA